MRGRFAPSPSGRMHLGNVFSALLAWASARSQNGAFVLRLEDLDERTRSKEHARLICDDLTWLGLDWDEQPLCQHEHLERYAAALETLEARAELYPCFCSRADLHTASAPHASDGSVLYAGTCRHLSPEEVERKRALKDPALRIHVPAVTVTVEDVHMGTYAQNLARECGDFVVRRSDGVFAYQLVCVVDDAASGVTEVVRGSDLLSSTPRQMFLQRLLGVPTPVYAHHPLLVDQLGRRLSKRDKDCDMGYIRNHVSDSETLVGYLAHRAGVIDTCERMSTEEFADEFAWDKIVKDDISIYDGFVPLDV